MTQINPYLHFGGNCREAMTFYRECLGGELHLMTVGEAPMADQMPPGAKDDVLHAHLDNGARTLMASDTRGIEGVIGEFEGLAPASAVSLMIRCAGEAEINDLFSKLSAGGAVTCPLGPQFWGATFGSLTDKFGINWLLEWSENPALESQTDEAKSKEKTMNGQGEAGAPRALVVKAQGAREIVMTRGFNAPRERVWNALSRPELLCRWWGSCGDAMTVCEMDFRVGGAWRFVVSGPQGEHGFRGEYCEIVPRERIVQTFEWEGMPGHISRETLTLNERDGQTTLLIHCLFDTPEDREGMLASDMEQGAGECYDRLEKLLADCGEEC